MEIRDFPHHRGALLVAWLLLWTPCALQTLAAQDSTRCASSRGVLTAALLKRVGSAVDGYRDGRPVWVVVRNSPPYEILGLRRSCAEAARLVAGAGDKLLGPYVAPSDAEQVPMRIGAFCKRPDTSVCMLTDSLFIPPLPIDSVVRITVTFQLRDGSSRTAVFNPDSVEAVFFTLSAVDKLLVPYYAFVYGIDPASKVHDEFYRFFTRRQPQ